MVSNSERPAGLVWQQVESSRVDQSWFHAEWEVHRAKVPGGWLILIRTAGGVPQGLTFYPDSDYRWDGGSVT